MLSTRWRKIVRDLWLNRARTILATLSMAVGVFAVGVIAEANEMMDRELTASWKSANPGDVAFWCEPFAEDPVRTIRNMPKVADAQGILEFGVRFRVGSEDWRQLPQGLPRL